MAQFSNLPLPPAGLGKLVGGIAGLIGLGYGATQSLFNVEGGHRAIVFNRFQGIKQQVRARVAAFLPTGGGSTRGPTRRRLARNWVAANQISFAPDIRSTSLGWNAHSRTV